MNKQFISIAAAATLSLGLTACNSATRATALPPGEYEKTTVEKDKYGTEIERTSNTTVRQDQYGRKSAVVETKTTKDPKGLFNKSTVSETRQVADPD